MSNVLHLDQFVEIRVYPWSEPFFGFVRGFRDNGVYIEAEEKSEDPLVDDYFILPFSQVKSL